MIPADAQHSRLGFNAEAFGTMLHHLLRRLRGREQPARQVAASQEYGGFELLATPIKESHGWRVAGSVVSGSGEARRTHDFIRADVYPSHDDAVDVSLRKGRQLVDERGESLFV